VKAAGLPAVSADGQYFAVLYTGADVAYDPRLDLS